MQPCQQPCVITSLTIVLVQVWRPGIDPIGEDEELEYDSTAYDCFHRLQLDWPCLRYGVLLRALPVLHMHTHILSEHAIYLLYVAMH